jgi:hypothetical protein
MRGCVWDWCHGFQAGWGGVVVEDRRMTDLDTIIRIVHGPNHSTANISPYSTIRNSREDASQELDNPFPDSNTGILIVSEIIPSEDSLQLDQRYADSTPLQGLVSGQYTSQPGPLRYHVRRANRPIIDLPMLL